MKANFALTLSFTGIRLLHRAAGGWRFVGEVALDDPDLDGALAALRRTALELEPSGLRTKLVVPGTQIRYLTIDTGDTPDSDIRAAAEVALDGATPYAVHDLAFDVSPDGDRTHVAAVARETLEEAEAFAIKHRFAPISLVGLPDGDDFLGEPFFGPTDYAKHVLGPDQSVEPDGIAVVELGPLEWPDGPVVDVSEDTPVAVDDPSPSAGAMPLVSSWKTAQVRDDGPAEQAEVGPTASDTEDAADAAPFLSGSRSVGFASRRRPGQDAAPSLGGVTRRFDPVGAAEPDAEEALPSPEEPTSPSTAKAETDGKAAPVDNDIPEPPAAVVSAFLSRRKSKAPVHDPRETVKVPATPEPAEAPPEPAPTEATEVLEQAEAAVGLPVSAYAKDRTPPEIRPLRVPRPQTERERMTVFGARQPEAAGGAGAVEGNPRFFGLALTAMLLVLLVGVAAWAAVFIDEGIARFFAPRTPEAPITAEEQPASPPMEDSASGPEALQPQETRPDPDNSSTVEQDLQTAALEPELQSQEDVGSAQDALAEPEEPAPFDPSAAAEQYAETGIWTVPPGVPEAPPLVGVDDLYVTSIDPPGDSFDAVALQPETDFRSDAAPLPLPDPAPPGTEFDLNERGLVIPTPDGAMTPDGIMVYSGPPPVVPPETPERAEEVTEENDAALREDLLRFRPRGRPTDLVENTERRQLGGLSRSELADYRPKVRPDVVKQAQEEDETPTAQAVASSLRPSDRPSGFSRIVARAEERNLDPVREAEPQQVAAAAPRAVAPSIPSRSSVTQEATVRNAINLRQINLMGVYGSPSNRRALIRLSSGRYKKVKVGDRIDGGRVSAIGDSELSYVKGNRNIVLRMPRT